MARHVLRKSRALVTPQVTFQMITMFYPAMWHVQGLARMVNPFRARSSSSVLGIRVLTMAGARLP